jgi:DMSO/TMAO reductase YedYZ molybdopterin-dependent catalytic subunit
MSVLSEMDTPVFAAEGMPEAAIPDQWKMHVDGMAGTAVDVNLSELKTLPNSTVNCRLTSVSGWSVRADWNGAPWREFIKAYPPKPGASHATFRSVGGYTTTVPLSALDHPRVLLCWGVGGEPLEVEYGGPLRMVIPNLWGYKSCKWLMRVTYTDRMIAGYWESRGYTDHGRIEPGYTMDVNTRTRRPIKGGEVIDF